MFTGSLSKMITEANPTADYYLAIGTETVHLNPLVGKNIELEYQQLISCTACGRKTSKSFGQGHCYPCFKKLARCDICIVRPERCHFDQGTCREPAWAEDFCFQPHYVYLANTSGIKVGITRASQIPTRWLDQGAVAALRILQAKNRFISGLAETAISEFVNDKTDWRRMLKGDPSRASLAERRDELLTLCAGKLEDIRSQHGEDALLTLDEAEWSTSYPVTNYPEKVKSLNFDKEATVAGVLQGIKGQYLILDTGVINIRKFTGYQVNFKTE